MCSETFKCDCDLNDFFFSFPHREQKDPIYLRDKVSQKHSKEQFESAQKIEQEYSKFFTGMYSVKLSLKKTTTHKQKKKRLALIKYFCLFRYCPRRHPPVHLHSDHDYS